MRTSKIPKKPKRKLVEFLEACKKARRYIIEHPGITKDELYAALPDCIGTIQSLQIRRLIRVEGGGEKGAARWFVVPA